MAVKDIANVGKDLLQNRDPKLLINMNYGEHNSLYFRLNNKHSALSFRLLLKKFCANRSIICFFIYY